MMIEETDWMKNILTQHYMCEPKENGVCCYSPTGIDDDEHWLFIIKAIKHKFSKRFIEVFHQVCSDHIKFTVYIRKIKE